MQEKLSVAVCGQQEAGLEAFKELFTLKTFKELLGSSLN